MKNVVLLDYGIYNLCIYDDKLFEEDWLGTVGAGWALSWLMHVRDGWSFRPSENVCGFALDCQWDLSVSDLSVTLNWRGIMQTLSLFQMTMLTLDIFE